MMSDGNFYSENKIDKKYSYGEVSGDGTTIEFGWFSSDEIDLGDEVVIAYHSRTKKASDDNVAWSKTEGNSAATLSDYKRYFVRSTGFQPSEFIEIYDFDRESLCSIWKKNGDYNEGTVDFLYRLSNLLVNKKKFIHMGRGYKVVKP